MFLLSNLIQQTVYTLQSCHFNLTQALILPDQFNFSAYHASFNRIELNLVANEWGKSWHRPQLNQRLTERSSTSAALICCLPCQCVCVCLCVCASVCETLSSVVPLSRSKNLTPTCSTRTVCAANETNSRRPKAQTDPSSEFSSNFSHSSSFGFLSAAARAKG